VPDACTGRFTELIIGQVLDIWLDSQYQRRECMTAWVGAPMARRLASTPAAAPRIFGYSSAPVGVPSV
jgi:hypothetical protein